MKIKKLNSQCLVDISMLQYGDDTGIFDLAFLNNVSITDTAISDVEISFRSIEAIKKNVTKVLLKNIPASDDIDFNFSFLPGIDAGQQQTKAIKKVLAKQVIIDLAMQETGNVEDLFLIAEIMSKSITQLLTPGEAIYFSIDNNAFEKEVVSVLNRNGNNPASAAAAETQESTMLPPGGIGFMRITNPEYINTNDFIVS